MAAADEIPVAGARHRVAVFRIVDDEDAPRAERQPRIGTVILELTIAFARPARERDGIAEIVAVDHVHRQSDAQCGAQRLRTDEVAAMDDDFGALGRRFAHRARERVGAVVTVRQDAELHASMIADRRDLTRRGRRALMLVRPRSTTSFAGAGVLPTE